MTAYMLSSIQDAERVVVDTNVFVGALRGGDGVNRRILELCFLGDLEPLMGDALYLEYASLLGRDELYENSRFTETERSDFFDDFCSICRWVEVHYRWRPNLRDEGDNHIVELALAGGANTVVTWNARDFSGGDMVLPELKIATPADVLRARLDQR